jgi:CheY-like chemotaxis protein
MKKILIVDSLKTTIEKEKNILLREDIRIFTASTSEEVLKIHRSENMDLILIDLDMPKMYGDKVCSIVRSDDALKKVSILIACFNKKPDIARCQACGANAFITKPIKSEELLRNVIKFLNITERINLRIILNIAVNYKPKNRLFFVNSENISYSGLLFETEEVLKKGDKIKSSFFIGESLINTEGKVVRVVKGEPNKNHYGVQFINLSPFSKAKIKKFIENFMEGK